jgi:hypothetical protein
MKAAFVKYAYLEYYYHNKCHIIWKYRQQSAIDTDAESSYESSGSTLSASEWPLDSNKREWHAYSFPTESIHRRQYRRVLFTSTSNLWISLLAQTCTDRGVRILMPTTILCSRSPRILSPGDRLAGSPLASRRSRHGLASKADWEIVTGDGYQSNYSRGKETRLKVGRHGAGRHFDLH